MVLGRAVQEMAVRRGLTVRLQKEGISAERALKQVVPNRLSMPPRRKGANSTTALPHIGARELAPLRRRRLTRLADERELLTALTLRSECKSPEPTETAQELPLHARVVMCRQIEGNAGAKSEQLSRVSSGVTQSGTDHSANQLGRLDRPKSVGRGQAPPSTASWCHSIPCHSRRTPQLFLPCM